MVGGVIWIMEKVMETTTIYTRGFRDNGKDNGNYYISIFGRCSSFVRPVPRGFIVKGLPAPPMYAK